MTSKLVDLLPPAKDFVKKLANAEAEEAAKLHLQQRWPVERQLQ